MNVNRRDYNAKHGTTWEPMDMFDPSKNVRVFADTVYRMLRVYAANGVPTKGREGLLLVTAGWNSGYGDVKRLAQWLRSRDLSVTHANLFRYAPQALPPASQYRWTSKKRRWQRSVVELYENQDDKEDDSWLVLALALWALS